MSLRRSGRNGDQVIIANNVGVVSKLVDMYLLSLEPLYLDSFFGIFGIMKPLLVENLPFDMIAFGPTHPPLSPQT